MYSRSTWDTHSSPSNFAKSRNWLNNIELGVEAAHNFLGNGPSVGSSWVMWDDLKFDANALKAAGVKDPAYSTCLGGELRAYWFSPTTQEELFFAVQFPHSWNGSYIYPHLHWIASTGTSTASEKIQWHLEYSWASIGSTMSAPTTIVVTSRTPNEAIVSNKHYISSFDPIKPTTSQSGISSMMLCRLCRDSTVAADDFEHGVFLLEFDIHFAMNMIGSRQEKTK